jgi:hypothetical protein
MEEIKTTTKGMIAESKVLRIKGIDKNPNINNKEEDTETLIEHGEELSKINMLFILKEKISLILVSIY